MDLSEQSERMQTYYNLKHDPFGAIVDTMVFSGAGGRYEIAETIRHLMTYSHQDSLLVSPQGSGKRTLALQVLKLLDEQWRIAWIDGSDIQSTSALLKELNGQFGLGLKIGDDIDGVIARISQAVSERYESEAFLIVVQFSEQLPQPVRDVLLNLRQNAADIDQRVRQLWLSDQWELLVQQLSEDDWYLHALERLSDDDAEQYLKDRLIAAGNTSEFPIPLKDISRLNQIADGCPAQLNEATRDYLISSTFKTTEKKQRFPLTHVFAGIAALALIAVAVVYKANESTIESGVEASTNTPVLSENLTSVEQRLAAAVARVEQKQNDSSSADPLPSAEPAIAHENEAVAPSISKQELAETTVSKPAKTITESLAPKASDEKLNTPLQVLEVAEPVSAEPEPATVPEKQATPEQNVERTSFFAKASANEFTMQLIGVQKKENLQPLTQAFPAEAQFEIIETTRNGKPWFILIYGLFPTKAAAQTAVSEVPASLNIKEPWIRTVGSIRSAG